MRPVVFFLVLLPAIATAQTSLRPTPVGAGASVTFRFEWSQGFPWLSYTIEVQSDGRTHFSGVANPAEMPADTDQQDFTMPHDTLQTIFDSAVRLHYFQADYDSHLKKIAQTGKKTLEYRSAETHGSMSFNWSENADVQELTRIFQGVALTLDYGRKLAFQYRFDRLGMNQRLRQLEEAQAGHHVEALNAIAPILRKIADDPNMMNISRESARHLLHIIAGAGSTASAVP